MKKFLLSTLAVLGFAGMAFAGDGSKANPYTPEEVLALTTDKTGVYVKGYIVGSATGASWSSFTTSVIGASQSNIGLANTSGEEETAYIMPVQLVANTDVRNALQLSSHPENIGHEVIIYGNATKYFSVMGIKDTSSYEWVGQAPDPSEAPKGPEFPSEVMTVSQALSLMAQGATGAAQVKGYISDITEVSTQYGNATYSLVDDLGSSAQSLLVYRGYYLDGDKFTAENQIARGAYVVVSGDLVNFNGTYEFTTGSKIVSYTDPSGEIPDVPTPEKPSGNSVTFDFTDPSSLGFNVGSATEYELTGESITSGIVTISFESASSASTKLRLFSSNGNWTMRFYKDTSFTVSVAEGNVLTGIEFDGSNLGKDWSYSNGSLNESTWTPSGMINTVTIGKTATGNNPAIKTLTVYYTDEAGVDGVIADDTEAVYFNLQGVRVLNPDRGIFVKVANGKATKVIK